MHRQLSKRRAISLLNSTLSNSHHSLHSNLRVFHQTAIGSIRSFKTTPATQSYIKVFGRRDDVDLTNRLVGVNESLRQAALDAARTMTDEERQRAAKAARKAMRKEARKRDQEHPFNGYDFTIAIVGRPNVGKSSIFNLLCGRASAITDGSSGVTRDWKEDDAYLAGLKFRLIDTAGLDEIDWEQVSSIPSQAHAIAGQTLRPEKRSGKGLNVRKGLRGSATQERDAKGMTAKYALGRPLLADLQKQILELTETAVKAVCPFYLLCLDGCVTLFQNPSLLL